MADRVVLHIGVHKTGTTAIQTWAHRNRAELRSRFDVAVYTGRAGAKNHIDLALLCMRTDRNLYARVMHPDSVLASWQAETRAHLAEQLATDAATVFFSAEALSYLRFADELERLRDLLGPRDVHVVAVLRERKAFLRSYRAQMRALGYGPSPYPESFNYVEDDTWVANFDDLIAAYAGAFGADRVHALSYEDAMTAYGSTIPAVARAAGLPVAELPDWHDVWLNASSRPQSFPARARRAVGHPVATVTRLARRAAGPGRTGPEPE